jgi:hypothetical protein
MEASGATACTSSVSSTSSSLASHGEADEPAKAAGRPADWNGSTRRDVELTVRRFPGVREAVMGRMQRRARAMLTLAAVLVLGAAGAGGYLAFAPVRGPGSLPPVTLPLTPAVARGGLVTRMLDAAIVPPGAVVVSSLPGSAFRQASTVTACTPLTDVARLWRVPGDPADVAAFLRAHPPSWLSVVLTATQSRAATGVITSYEVGDALHGKSFGNPAGLDFTVASLPGGMTGIRADAELVPPHALCTRSGGGAAAGGPVTWG